MTGDAILEILGCRHDDPRLSPLLELLGERINASGRSMIGDSFSPPGLELSFLDGVFESVSFGHAYETLPHELTWNVTVEELHDVVVKKISVGGGEPGGTAAEYERDGVRVSLVFDHGMLVDVSAWRSVVLRRS